MPTERQAGYYGKLPSRGDFVSQSLPGRFTAPWDAWLQACVHASREALGDEWLDTYMSAPLWRFLLAPGVAGLSPVAGVLCPSVDRVGRYFPLTIACELDPSIDMAESFIAALDWFAGAEALALGALEPTLDVDAFNVAVAELGEPATAPSRTVLRPTVGAQAAPRVLLHAVAEPGSGTSPLVRQVVRGQGGHAAALWMTQGSEVLGDCIAASDGLPEPRCFAGFLDGAWARHGWRDMAEAG
jgi:type VI secretion system protein ImpM